MRVLPLFLILIVTAISFFGCATINPDVSHIPIEGKNVESGIGYYDKKADGKKKDISFYGFFVLVEEKANNVWVINKISGKPITRENLQQEILYVDDSSIQTYYEDYEIALFRKPDRYFFDCRDKNKNKPTYNPCNSKLTAISDMGFAYYGKGAFRLIDGTKIAEIVKQTNLIAKVEKEKSYLIAERQDLIAKVEKEKQECEKQKLIARDFINKIIVEPTITDKSGFFKGEDVVSISKNIDSKLTCPVDLNDIRYSISLHLKYGYSFAVNINPSRYELKYNSEGYSLKPIVTIIAKTFENIFPRYINEDNALRIEFDGERIRFVNKTNYFLQIKTISNFNFGDKALELAPQATTKEPLLINSYITPAIKKMSEYRNITKDSALQQNISFGFAIKYRLVEQNIDRTLYKQNEYNLYKIVSIL